MGKGVGVVPPQLLGGEVANAALGEELGQLPGEAKGIGQPGDRAGPAQFLQTVALAVEDLPGDRLSPRQVQVRFYPQSGVNGPAPGLYLLLQGGKKGWAVLL